jgi:hypothetical protein
MDKYLQIKKSIIDEIPTTILFGELAISDKDNILRLYAGDQTGAPIKIYDQSTPAEYIYENNKQKYVAIGGSDLNNGQSGFPLQSIQYALTKITAAGCLSIEAGIYNEYIGIGSDDAIKALIGQFTSNIYNVTELSNVIEIFDDADRMTFSNLEFSSSTATTHILINSTSSTQNSNFNNISISGSTLTNSNVIKVQDQTTAAGYINIDGCDFANRILLLENSTLPRFCFITSSRNITLNAGTNWIVVIDDNSTVIETSSNNNIINSNIVTDIISVAPSSFGFYLLSADVTISSVVYPKGSLIVYNGVAVTYTTKYYRNKSSYFVILKNQTYVKTGSDAYSVVTAYPIILPGF